MTRPAPTLSHPQPAAGVVTYEQPLTERMRTFLRLEFLFEQAGHHAAHESTWETRAAVASLLDIVAILQRGDICKEALKDLERAGGELERYQSSSGVDHARLDALLAQVHSLRDQLSRSSQAITHGLRSNEFLSSVRHRSAIPGGTCEFDLPDYSHWLSRSYEQRSSDFDAWMRTLAPLRDTVIRLLWLTRERATESEVIAVGGLYQHSLERKGDWQLLRVTLPASSNVYPEISGSQHRFTVRFHTWTDVHSRPAQTTENVSFLLTCC